MSMKDLLKKTQTEAELALEKAKEADAKKLAIAEWFDAQATEGCPLPKYIHLHTLYGSVASLKAESPTPAQVLALMEAFPPVEFGVYRGTFASIMAKSFFESSEKAQHDYTDRQDGGRVFMELERTAPRYPTKVSVNWWTAYGDQLVQFDCEFGEEFGPYLPSLDARAVEHQGVLMRLEHHSLGLVPGAPQLLQLLSYAAFDKTGYPRKILGGDVAQYLNWITAKVEAERAARRDAFMHACMEGVEPVKSSGPYENQGMRAGTKEQHECLNTIEARLDHAMAKEHWQAYCEYFQVDSKQNYFDHFTWAKHWLKKHDLEPHKTTLDGKEIEYRYGSQWL